jgi:hypothetical protein
VKVIVGFSYGNMLVSRIIKWFTQSDVSHTYIKIKAGLMGSDIALHADPGGVMIHLEEVFNAENHVVEEYEIDDIRVEQSITRNLKHLGKGYDYWKLVSWAWIIAFKRWVKQKIQNPIEDPSKMICVDLVIRILNGAGVTKLDYGTMKPNDLRQWVRDNHEQLGWKRIV